MEMTKKEAKEFLEKYTTVVGGMEAIAILAGSEESQEGNGGETTEKVPEKAPKCNVCGKELVNGVCPDVKIHGFE